MEPHSIVVYLDILGFSHFVVQNPLNKCIDVLKEFQSESFTINNSIREMSRYAYKKNGADFDTEKLEADFKFLLLSDSVVLAMKYHPAEFAGRLHMLFTFLIDFQLKMFTKNLPLRGGIAFGEFYSNENILIGKGLVKAVELEKCAVFPRILIDREVFNILDETDTKLLYHMILSDDSSKNCYLDLFKYYSVIWDLTKAELFETNSYQFKKQIDDFTEIISQYILDNLDNEKLLPKINWLDDKLNGFLIHSQSKKENE